MKKSFLLLLLTLTGFCSIAQLSRDNKDTLSAVRTAENLVSGNTKDVLTSFFQLAANDLTGNNKEFKFSSSIFAIMLKSNPSLNMDKRYFTKGSFARNTSLNWAIKLDSSYRFNGASFGFKTAIINRRDLAVSKRFLNDAKAVLMKDFDMHDALIEYIQASTISDTDKRNKLFAEAKRVAADTTGYAFNHMSPDLKSIYIKAYSDSTGHKVLNDMNLSGGIPSQSFYASARASFDSLKTCYATKPIVVLGCDLKTYKDQFMFSEINIYLDGTGSAFHSSGNDVDFDWVLKANLHIQDDSTRAVRDLTRNLLNAEGGFNIVFRNKVAISTFEMKVSAAYEKIFTGKYAWEHDKLFTLNGTARIRISKDLTIPMTIKYDPEHSNVLGLLSITSNFDGLANLLSSKN